MSATKRPGLSGLLFSTLFLLLASTLSHAQCSGTGPYTCTETQSVSISNGPSGGAGTYVPANVYPSELTVSGLSGTIATIKVQLNGLTADAQGNGCGTSDMGVLLKAPNGTYMELMGLAGNCDATNLEDWSSGGVTLTIQDGATAMPYSGDSPCTNNTGAGWPHPTESGGFNEGTFAATSCPFGNDYDIYPSPGPGALTSATAAAPFGGATLSGMFDSITPNGTWSLYLVDDGGEFAGEDDISISGWSLILTLNSAASSTTTTLNSSVNPSFTTGADSSVTLTATVTGASTVNVGTVAFKNGSNTISCAGGNQTVSNGQATCITTFTTQGNQALTADYSGGSGFVASDSPTLNQFVETPTTGSFCNAGGITLPGQDDTEPYPSVINVSGVSNAVATVSLTLDGFSWNASADAVHLLLVSPSNQALEFFAATTDATGGTYTFTDTGTQITETLEESSLPPGTYQPAVYTAPPPPEDVFTPQPPFPAPQVPSSFNVAAPRGNPTPGTFENTFNGATANGAWSLFAYDDAGTTANGSITGGWCLDITQASGAATTTNVASNPNPALAGVSVSVTATVKSGGNPVAAGTVTFTENGQNVAGGPTSPVTVNGSGQASFSTTSLPEGDHNILATYNGVPSTYAFSFGSRTQRVDNASTSSINAGVYSYCNPGTITIPSTSNSTDEGDASPNPSNIFVANAPGTIKQVTVTLNGVELSTPYYLTSLLVGPLNTTADSLDFFSDVGGSTPMTSPVNVTLDDSASSLLSTGAGGSALESGTYKPTSAKGNDTFFASSDGYYTPPASPYPYAPPIGSSTLTSAFESQNPNGTWSLYLNQDNQSTNSSMRSWCVNLTENPPVLAIEKSHTGNFTQGDTGDTYTIQVTNNGPGATGGTVTVVEVPPSALTVTGMSGNNWSCSGDTCTRSDALNAENPYDPITVTVNVAINAPSSVTNDATVSGGGSAGTQTATDLTTVLPAVASISAVKSVTSTGPYSAVGQVISYQFLAINTGNLTLTSVGITDTQTAPAGALTSGPTCVSLSSPTGACSGSTTTLAPGQSATFTATYTITQADLNNGSVSDSAVAIGTSPSNSAVTSQSSSLTVDTLQSPGLSLVKSANPPTYSTVGTQIHYTYQVSNTGNTTLNGPFTVADNKTTVTCPALSTLAPGASLTCTATYTITQADIDAGSVTNLATAKNGAVSSPQSSATVTAIQSPGISLAKSANPTTYSNVGTTINYSYQITNTGNTTLSGPFTVTDNKTTVTCPPLSVLAPGASLTCTAAYTITQADINAGSVTNLAAARNATVNSPQASATVTAVQTTYLLTTAANPPNGGTVTPTSGGSYSSGTVVPLTASPASGYAFVNWTSSPGSVASSTSPTTTITMNAAESVTANFVASQLRISKSTLDFGTVYLNNTYHELAVTITNVSTSTITVSGVTIVPGTADASAYRLIEYCKGQIKPKQVCVVAVDFLADAVGTLTATLNIADNAAGSPQQVNLTANVIDPVADLSPKPLMFGQHPVSSQTTLPVQLTNGGQTDLTISNIAIAGANAGDFSQSNSCPSTLAPTASCTIEVTFTPSAKGGRGATLTVSGNMATGKATMELYGIGH